VARLLAISDETFKRLEEKYLKPIQIAAATSGHTNASEQERLLGLNPTWSKEQKLAQLTKEFAKYNARMQSAKDETQRAQCRRMLELIAAIREEIITGRKPTPPPNRDTPPPLPRPASGGPRPVIPPAVGSKDEMLIGVYLNRSPGQKTCVPRRGRSPLAGTDVQSLAAGRPRQVRSGFAGHPSAPQRLPGSALTG
jgi:hypothetical protein